MRFPNQQQLQSIIPTIAKVCNWPQYFLERLGFLRSPTTTYTFRDGRSYTARTNTADRGIINTVAIQDEYAIESNPPARGVIIDIGGQNGYFAVFASRYADALYTYEPVPENYTMLVANIANNALEKIVKPHNVAVSGVRGTMRLNLSPNNTGGHSMYAAGGTAAIDVPTTTLPDIFESNNIDRCALLKMDIEGSEYDIFYNLPDAYFEKIDEIRMEVHDIDTEQKQHDALVDFLAAKGYEVTCVMPLLFAKRKG